MTNFPTSKIELHQWVNSILLGIVGFFAMQTYLIIQKDHERIAEHSTEIAVVKEKAMGNALLINNVIGRLDQIGELQRDKKKSDSE